MRSLIADTFVSLAIAIAVMFVAELTLRVLYPEKVLEVAEDRRRIQQLAYAFDPETLVVLKPNVVKEFADAIVTDGKTIEWQTNSVGFRGPELEKNPDLRVIVYGDSNVQARFSSLKQTYAYRLQSYLSAQLGKEVEVINGGVVGSGPDQSFLRMKKHLDAFAPDLVIFHVFADNDFGDLIRNRLFEIQQGGELVRTRFPAARDGLLSPFIPRLLIVRAALSAIGQVGGSPPASADFRSTDLKARVEAYSQVLAKEFAVYKRGEPKVSSHFADMYDYDVSLEPDAESSKAKVALMDAVLSRAHEAAKQKGTKFLVLIQPSTRDLTKNREVNYTTLEQFDGYQPDRLSRIIDDICAKRSIPRINLFPLFAENAPNELYFMKDDHWNNRGQDLAALRTAGYVRDELFGGAAPSLAPAGPN